MRSKKRKPDVPFEESLNDDWSHDLNMVEVPMGNRPFFALGVVIFAVVMIVLLRILYLDIWSGSYFNARSESNVAQSQETPAPRGIIYDREGDPLVENKASFEAVLDARAFLSNVGSQAATLASVQTILNIDSSTVWSLLDASQAQDFATPVVLADNLTQTQLVNLQSLGTSTIKLEGDFERHYLDGAIYSSVLGYTGHPTQNDLVKNPRLTANDVVGKTGLEEYYDSTLQGIPGVNVQFRNAQGKVLGQQQQSSPAIGEELHLTIDGGLQTNFYNALANKLTSLGRTVGFAIAINPQNGQVLSMVNLPGYDNNIFSQPSGNGAQIQELLTSSEKPLFDRPIGGAYNPGSTIKPLDGVAALKEGIVDPTRTMFSPGYLLVPNPYNSSTPTKYLDWRYQGTIDLASALAQSSDVYFYIVGGGSPQQTTPPLNDSRDYGIGGLGISRLNSWWQTFGLGKPTGIDMPGEATGFLPTPDWKKKTLGTSWLLGDSYNVSIGQGDLLVSPLQLLSYIGAIANGGSIYRPFLNASSTPHVNYDLTYLLPQIQAVQQGMRETVTSPLGTAYTLKDLPMSVCAKTGSAQIQNNAEENALFVGYAPCDHPTIAMLILIENSKEGSLNAVPIAHEVFNWYYENRLK